MSDLFEAFEALFGVKIQDVAPDDPRLGQEPPTFEQIIGSRSRTPARAYAPRSLTRSRRSKAEMHDLRATIIGVLVDEQPLTLRQLYYRLVSADAIPKTEAGYGTVKRLLLDLRESGRVPWSWVVDNTRWVTAPDTYSGPEQALRAAARFYRRDLMASQPVRIEVWAESDSIGAVLTEVTEEYGIPLYIGRGYASRGYLHSAAEQIVAAAKTGKRTLILHLGDYDPSGEDIARSVRETLTRYFNEAIEVAPIPTFERLAVTEEQIAELYLPSRPAKTSDPRTANFHGSGTVEIEAIPRAVILDILRRRIDREIDHRQLQVIRVAERSERDILERFAAEAAS
jgi:hypothetical protein